MWTSQLRDYPRDNVMFSATLLWWSLALTESYSAAYVTRLDLWSFLSRPTFSARCVVVMHRENAAIVAQRDRPLFLPPR